MQKQYFELDPHGDVLLILQRPNQHKFDWNSPRSRKSTPVPELDNAHGSVESSSPIANVDDASTNEEIEQAQFLLSSRHLSLASPIFRTMLSGGWKESTILDERPRKIARLENNDTSNPEPQVRHELSATEWNTEALLLLMNIIHGHHRKLPDMIGPEALAHFAILVDYYKCHEITEVFVRLWMDKIISFLPKEYCEHTVLWIFVSWVFSDAHIFHKMTEQAIMESQGPVDAMSLPLPPAVVGAIDRKRASSIHKILHWLDKYRELLVKGDTRLSCGFECSSMLLGALIKGMEQHRISEIKLLGLGSDRSIKQIRRALSEFQTPVWHSRNAYNHRLVQHACTLANRISPGIDKIFEKSRGLKLDGYRVQKKDQVPTV